MYLGLTIYSGTPVWILAVLSFVIAVVIVSALEVGFNELMFKYLKIKLKRAGFEIEKYYEARFYVEAKTPPDEMIKDMMKYFNLKSTSYHEYIDRYFYTNLPSYSGRIPKLRMRKRDKKEGGFMQTAQIVYTRAAEISKRGLSQYRFFPLYKEKIYAFFDQEMPETIDEIQNENIRKVFTKYSNSVESEKICFQRALAYDPETLLISVDYIHEGTEKDFYLVELKAYKDKILLKNAMKYVMNKFSVVQTTHGKYDLIKN